MKDFFEAARLLLLDLASTLVFVVVFLLTHNTVLAVSLGMAIGVAQIAAQLIRRKPIAAMEWLSLFLVITAGGATLLTDDPRFILFKPSVIYVIVGIVMLKPGWMNRYLPAITQAVAADVAFIVGFVWAGLMFVSAAINAIAALSWSPATWAVVVPAFGILSKVVVFVFGFIALRLSTVRRLRAMPAGERETLLRTTGRYQQPSSLAEPV